MGWAYEQRTKKFNKHEYLILNLGWHLLRSKQTSSNLQFEPLLKQEMKMPKITNFFVPKIYSLFSCCAYFICSFIRCQTLNILFCVTFIQKGFCVMTFVRYQKRQRKSSGPRGANRTNKKKSNKIGCAHSESLIKTLTWNYGIYSVLKLLKCSHFWVQTRHF